MRLFGLGAVTSAAIPVLVFITVLYPPAALVTLLLHYKEASTSLERLVALYASLLIICANLNFDLVLHAPVSAPPFTGVHAIWLVEEGRVSGFSWLNVLLAAVDCFHFAIETLSTVGYGDIVPVAWYAKLAVDVEILMGLSITILAVGTHFSGSRS